MSFQYKFLIYFKVIFSLVAQSNYPGSFEVNYSTYGHPNVELGKGYFDFTGQDKKKTTETHSVTVSWGNENYIVQRNK